LDLPIPHRSTYSGDQPVLSTDGITEPENAKLAELEDERRLEAAPANHGSVFEVQLAINIGPLVWSSADRGMDPAVAEAPAGALILKNNADDHPHLPPQDSSMRAVY